LLVPKDTQLKQQIINMISAKSILHHTIPIEGSVITIMGNLGVKQGIELLIQHSITSVPVYDVRECRHNSFLSFLDICYHTMKIYNDPISDSDKEDVWRTATCSEVANMSKTCSFLYLRNTDNIQTAMLKMVSLSNIRRLPVMNLQDEMVGLLTQSNIITTLAPKIDNFPCAKLTIEDLNLGTLRSVKTVNTKSKVRDAFAQLVEYNIYGIPVVDDKNTVVGNISASDIQIIVAGGFSKLEHTVESILPETHQRRSPITIRTSQTVAEAFKIMSTEKIHRLFIVDDKNCLLGLISPVDLIQVVIDQST